MEGEFAVVGVAGFLEEDAGFGSTDAEGEFDGIGEAGLDAFADDEAVDDDFDGWGGGGVDFGFGDFLDLAVDADADEALALEVSEEAFRFGSFLLGDGGEDDELGAFGLGSELGNDFRGTHASHCFIGFGVVRDACGSPDDAKVVVDFGGGCDGGSWRKAAYALLDGNGGVEAFDGIDIGFFELGEELAGVGGERLDVAALAFGVKGVEGEGGFPGSRGAGDNGEFPFGDGDREVFEVMLAGTADEDIGHVCGNVNFETLNDKEEGRFFFCLRRCDDG